MIEADEILAAAAKTFVERKAVYGYNYKRCGAALAALFPDGVVLKTQDDHDRMHILSLIIVKISRYCVNWDEGGHQDSVHDAMVYCAMLEMIDGFIKAEESGDTGGDHATRLAESLGLVEELNASEADRYVSRELGDIEQELATGAALDESGADPGTSEQGDGGWEGEQRPNPGASSTRDLDALAGRKGPDVSAAGWR